MKQLIANYTFNAAAKTVTLTDINPVELSRLQLVTNVTDNIIIYNFADTSKGATVATNVITLEYDTTSMDNGDKLQIFYDLDTSNDTQIVSVNSLPLPTGSATAANQTTMIGHLDGVEGLLTTIDTDTGNIATSTSSIDSKTPALGQALAAASVPVVLPAAQISTLTPPAAITGYALETTLQSVKTAVETIDNAIAGSEMQVDVVSSALPTGAATAANQATIIGHVDGIETLLTTIDADTSNLSVVGGGLEANAIRVTLASDSTGVLSVDDNGSSLTVDANNLDIRDLSSASDSVSAVVTSLPNEGQQTMANSISVAVASDQSKLPVTLQDSTGDSAMDDTNNAVRVNVVAGGAGDGALLDGVSSSIKATVFDYTNSNPLAVRLTDTSGDYVSAGGGTQYTEDAAAAANPTGTVPILVRTDTPATQTTTDGDNIAQRGTNYGAAYVQVLTSTGSYVDSFGGGTQYTEGATDASITGTAMLMEGAADTLLPVQGTVADGLLVNLGGNNDVTVAGVSTLAEQQTQTTHLATIAGDTTNIETSVQLIDDTVATLGTTTYTEAATKGLVIGAVRRDADTTLVDTTNEVTPLQVDSNGRLKVEVFSGETLPVSLTSTTVTGTVAVTQSGTWDEVGINDSGNSITVDAPVATPVFVRLSDGAAAISTLPVSLASVPSHAVTNAGTFAVQAAQSGTWNVTNVSGTVSLPTGASTLAEQQTQTTSLQLIDDAVATTASAIPAKGIAMSGTDGTNARVVKTDTSGELQVDVLTLPAITATDLDIRNLVAATDAVTVHGDVGAIDQLDLTNSNPAVVAIVDANGDQITSFGGGTQYTEDVAAAADPVGTALIGVRADALTAVTTTDGDNVAARMTNKGELYVKHVDSIPVTDNGGALTVDNGGTFAVQAAQSGTWNITNISGTVSLPTGASTLAEQQTQTTSLQLIDDAIVADDAAFTPATTKVAMAGFTFDDVSPDAVNEGDAGAARMSSRREIYTQIRDAAGNERGANVNASNEMLVALSSVPSHAVTNAGTFAVQESGAALTALQLIDDTVFTDDAAFTVASSKVLGVGLMADEASTDSVNEGDIGIPRMTLDRKTIVVPEAHTAGGATPYQLISAASTNATSVKASAGQLYNIYASNINGSARYLKIYNKASAPTVGTDTPLHTFLIPGSTSGGAFSYSCPVGEEYSTGIAFAITSGAAVADTGAVAATDIVINLAYK